MFGTLSKKNQICIKYENGYFPPLLRYVKYNIKKLSQRLSIQTLYPSKRGHLKEK